MNKKIIDSFRIDKTIHGFINSLGKDKENATILSDFKLKTNKKNQLLAFFKPEVFS